MSDIVQFGFSADTSGLTAADTALLKLQKTAESVDATITRMTANAASAFSRVSSSMSGMAGPSAAGGTMASPFGPAWTQGVAGATAATQALSLSLQSQLAAMSSLEAAAKAATAALAGVGRHAPGGSGSGGIAPPRQPRPSPTQGQAERDADALRDRLEPLAAAHRGMSDAVARYDALLKAGHITQSEFIGGVKLEEEALKRAASAHTAHGNATYQNRLQMMELAHVARAFVDSIAAGANPLRVLAMEGGRLQLALSTGEGGVTGLLTRMGGAMSGLLNPAALATGAIAALGVASVAAFTTYEAGQDRLTNALNGIGRRSGATVAQLNAIASAGSLQGGLSTSEGIGLAAQYAHAGIGANSIAGLIGVTKDYGRLTGQDTEKAGGTIAGALADPSKGLAELDKQLGFVDDRLKQEVDDLERSGHMAQAQALAMEAFKRAVENTTDTTWGWKRAMEGAENWLSNKFGQLGGAVASAVGADSPAEQLKRYRDLLPSTSTGLFALGDRNTDTVQAKITTLEKQVAAQDAKAAADKRDADATSLSRQAGDAVRAMLPDLARVTSARDTIETLRQALADPEIRRHMSPEDARLTGRAYGNAVVLADNLDPTKRARQDYDIRMAGIGEMDVENKALLAARKAELDVMRQTGDVLRAASAAQMTLNEAIKAANEEADDRARTAKQNLQLVGLSPYDRAMQEIRNKYDGPDGLIERNRFDSTRATDDADIRKDLTGAQKLVMAGQDAAEGISGAGSRLVAALDGVTAKIGGGAPAAFGPYGAGPKPMTGGTTVAAGAAAFNAAPADIQTMIRDASSRTGIDPNIIAAIGRVENGYKLTGGTTMLGSDGRPSSAYGYGQLTNGAARDVASAVPGFSKYDPNTAVFGAAEYLKILSDRNHGDIGMALRAYGGTDDYAAKIARAAGGGIPIPSSQPLTIRSGVASVAPIASTASASYRNARDSDLAATQKGFDTVPIDQANRSLQLQVALLDTQRDTFGQSAAAIRGAAEAQTLWNKLAADGVVPIGDLSKATGGLADKVKAYQAEATKVAQQQDDQTRQQRSIVDTADFARNGVSNVLSSGLTAAAHGKSFGDAAGGALSNLGDQLIGKGVNGIIGSLLGGQGQGFGGLLGGLFHFAGGTQDAPGGLTEVGESGPEMVVMPPHAQVMTASQTQGFMGSARAPNVTVGGHSIVVQGNADKDTIAMFDQKLAAANEQQYQRIIRDLPQIQRDSLQTG